MIVFSLGLFPLSGNTSCEQGIQVYGREITASEQLARSLIREKEAAETANEAKSRFTRS